MCRVAQGSVVDDIAASIATHTGIINKQKSSKAGLFATTPGGGSSDPSNPMSERFRLAASRVQRPNRASKKTFPTTKQSTRSTPQPIQKRRPQLPMMVVLPATILAIPRRIQPMTQATTIATCRICQSSTSTAFQLEPTATRKLILAISGFRTRKREPFPRSIREP